MVLPEEKKSKPFLRLEPGLAVERTFKRLMKGLKNSFGEGNLEI